MVHLAKLAVTSKTATRRSIKRRYSAYRQRCHFVYLFNTSCTPWTVYLFSRLPLPGIIETALSPKNNATQTARLLCRIFALPQFPTILRSGCRN